MFQKSIQQVIHSVLKKSAHGTSSGHEPTSVSLSLCPEGDDPSGMVSMTFCVSAQAGIPWYLWSHPVLPHRGTSTIKSCLFHCTLQPWLHGQGKEKESTGQQKADSCPCCLEEGQKFEKQGERGGCPRERWVVLAWTDVSSAAVKRKGGNKLPGTRRMKDHATEITYSRYSHLSTLGVLLMLQAFSSSESSIIAMKYSTSASSLNNSDVKMRMRKKMILWKDCFVFDVTISFFLCTHTDTNKSVNWMHKQTPSLITSFPEQKQGNRGVKKKKQAKVI